MRIHTHGEEKACHDHAVHGDPALFHHPFRGAYALSGRLHGEAGDA